MAFLACDHTNKTIALADGLNFVVLLFKTYSHLAKITALTATQQGCIDAAALPTAATGASAGEPKPEPGWQNWRQWMQPPRELDLQVPPAVMQRRTWRYWLERTAAALGHRAPAGLYDAQVRARFKAFMGDSARANQ